jgi:hypothetical protein
VQVARVWRRTHQPSPSPLEMSKTYSPPFGLVVWAFVLLHCVCHHCSSPLVRFSFPLCLLCAGCKSVRRSASTSDITFGGEQDLPTPLWSYYLRVCVVALCSPSLQLPLRAILLPPLSSLCAGCMNTRKSVSTIAITSRGE